VLEARAVSEVIKKRAPAASASASELGSKRSTTVYRSTTTPHCPLTPPHPPTYPIVNRVFARAGCGEAKAWVNTNMCASIVDDLRNNTE